MNNAALKERLDDFGDHLEVAMEDAEGNLLTVAQVDTVTFPEGPMIVLETES